MLNLVCSMVFILAQNDTERAMTIFGLVCLAGFLFYLILDSTIKGKLVPKKGPVRGFLIFLLIVVVIVFNLIIIFNK